MNFYSYFYVVLVNQDYSLITGSDRELLGAIALFGFLAIAMYFTRHRNWLKQPPSSESQ
jgi:inner membrane protein involved in colicin E2 resistance